MKESSADQITHILQDVDVADAVIKAVIAIVEELVSELAAAQTWVAEQACWQQAMAQTSDDDATCIHGKNVLNCFDCQIVGDLVFDATRERKSDENHR